MTDADVLLDADDFFVIELRQQRNLAQVDLDLSFLGLGRSRRDGSGVLHFLRRGRHGLYLENIFVH